MLVILSEAGIPLPGGLMNKTILEIIISQQKFAIFALEAFRKIKTVGLIDIFWQVYQVKIIKEILYNLSLQTYGRPGDCLSHVLFDNTLFFSIRRKYVIGAPMNVSLPMSSTCARKPSKYLNTCLLDLKISIKQSMTLLETLDWRSWY